MAYGWVLTNPKSGRIIAKGTGPGSGRGSSLRAEGFGMLAALKTIELACEYTRRTEPVNIEAVSDNAELIQRCNAHLEYIDPFPNTTNKGEYDVTEEVYRTSQVGVMQTKFSWVKGHQDDDDDVINLDHAANMNIIADGIAGDFNQEQGKIIPCSPLLPSCPAQLRIGGITVSSNYKQQIFNAYTEPRYIKYVMDRFGWNETVVTSIAWKCYKLANKRIKRTSLVTKISNDLLPTAARMCKMHLQTASKCAQCDEVETFDHIVRCECESRAQWRRSVTGDLRKTMLRYSTHDDIIQCMIECVDQWFKDGFVIPEDHPECFRNAIWEQNQIGWRHLFMGKLSREWLAKHSEMKVGKPIAKNTKRVDDYIWGGAIAELLLNHSIQVWELRNKELHGDEGCSKVRKQRLDLEVRELQLLKDDARPQDAFMFITDVDKYLEKATVSTLTTYLAMTKKAILSSVKRWKKNKEAGVNSVIEWLQMVPGNAGFIRQAEKKARKH